MGKIYSLIQGDISSQIAAIKQRSFVNNRVAMIGDSRCANGDIEATSGFPKVPYLQNIMWWANFYSYGKFSLSRDRNFGVTGERTWQILDRVDAALAASDAAFWLCVFTVNDVTTFTPAETREYADALIKKLVDAGRMPIIVCETPRGLDGGTFPFTGGDLQNHLANAEALRIISQKYNCILIDPWPLMLDYNSTYFTFRVGYTVDEVHLAAGGAMVIGKMISDIVGPLLSPGRTIPHAGFDIFQATNNPYGSLISNPTMVGGAGTNGAGSSGVVATSYNSRCQDAAMTVACAKITEAGTDRVYQKLTIAGTPTTTVGFAEMQIAVDVSQLVVGASYVAKAEIMLEAGYANFVAPTILLTPTTVGKRQWGPLVQSSEVPVPFSTELRGLLQTDTYDHEVTELVLAANIRFYFKQNLPASAVARIYGFTLNRVT